jgi:hypothetical protein
VCVALLVDVMDWLVAGELLLSYESRPVLKPQ